MGCLSNILPLVLLIGINWAETDIQNRRLTCGADQSHTLCLPDVGNACQVNNDYLVNIGLSTKEQNEMVDLHNKYRADIAEGKVSGLPPASNMQKMSWNEDLAQVAQKWADQCLFDHDTGDARKTPQFEHVGQNIYLQKISKKVPGIKVKKAVKKWFGEVQDFDEHQISPFEFTYNTGHFSQLVWAETSEVLLKIKINHNFPNLLVKM